MLQIHYPTNASKAIHWVLSIIFDEFLGVEYIVKPSTKEGYCLELNGKQLEISDWLFSKTHDKWLVEEPMIKMPLPQWDPSKSDLSVLLSESTLPVVFGEPHVNIESHRIDCHIDIVGTVFYFLSRYEEMVIAERDQYDRFPATASLAHRVGILQRPIVDEYVEVLWACMNTLWPALKRKSRQGKVRISCDVDAPYECSTKSASRLAQGIAGDLLKRLDFSQAVQRIQNFVSTQRGNYMHDPFNTFEWYMDTCERYGHQAAFYFIADHSSKLMDGCYEIFEPRILELLTSIAARDHEIGTHASFNTYQDGKQLSHERQRLKDYCEKLDIDASVVGNRQHYLRWDVSQTADHLDAAGYEYDSTGVFADRPGFRYGTSRPFSMWSWQKQAPLTLKQRPLVLMECSVIAERYMGLGYSEEAKELMLSLKRNCLTFGGDFTMLWHNSHLSTDSDKNFFCELLS